MNLLIQRKLRAIVEFFGCDNTLEGINVFTNEYRGFEYEELVHAIGTTQMNIFL